MRDYDKLTPRERREKAAVHYLKTVPASNAPDPKCCSKCGGGEFHGEDGIVWLADLYAGDYVRKCLNCGNEERATKLELAAARAQDQKGAMPSQCQDNSVDAGVTMSQLIEAMCRCLEPAAACRAAEQAFWEGWITEDVCKRLLNDREWS